MALEIEEKGGFRFYSLGIVTKDKVEGSDIIEVTPIEDLPMELGDLTDNNRVRESSLGNIKGVSKTDKVIGGSVVKAKWTPLSNPNRDNAPDVYRSETVILYRYADTQDYYWSTIFREPKLRGRERVRVSLSNKDPGGDSYDSDTSYWVEFDTRHKHVKIHTSSNDGEPTSYDITLNTKDGIFTFEDELGNSIRLESVPGHLEVTTENSITVNTKRYVLNASESVEINTPNYTLNATDSSEVNTENNTLNATKSTVNGDTETINSAIVGTEGFKLSGGDSNTGEFIGNFKVIGNVDVDGNIDASGSITDAGGNTPHHSH